MRYRSTNCCALRYSRKLEANRERRIELQTIEIAFRDRQFRFSRGNPTLISIEDGNINSYFESSFETLAGTGNERRDWFESFVVVAKTTTQKEIGNPFGTFARKYGPRPLDTCLRHANVWTLLEQSV